MAPNTDTAGPEKQGVDTILDDPSAGSSSRLRVRRGAKALFQAGDRVLLVRERRGDGSTFWTLPGGGAEPGESYRECLRRELREELQCGPHIGPVSVAVCRYRHTTLDATVTVYAVFPGRLGGRPIPDPSEGVVNCAWCRPSSPPANTLPPFRELLEWLAGQRSTEAAGRGPDR